MKVCLPFAMASLLALLILGSCNQSESSSTTATTAFDEPPNWSRSAIWYQIFVERFRNGDPTNDPTLTTIANAVDDELPADWAVTPWGANWYQQEDWAAGSGLDFYRTVQMRRVGGDLQGVMDKLDYLADLGITAIYFNPINDAPSLHKFDARNYRHVDVTFGPDPIGDQKLIAQENPTDPTTWTMTAADSLFFAVVDRCHAKGIKVVVDFSWNHTGRNFWAFQDIVQNQSLSAYKDWYEIVTYDDPSTAANEFEYEGWFGIKNLPELKKSKSSPKVQGHPYDGDLYPGPKQHIFNVCNRYMDPNGDGDTSDGIDGMRLDVAEHVPMGFWRDFRKHVRSINPDFYLVGECWWTTWPDTLMDPAPWVEGDVFDAVMHYQWYKPTRAYLLQSDDALTLAEWQYHVDSIFRKYPTYTQEAMMNLAASHDSPRLATSMANGNKYKYNASPGGNASYNIGPLTSDDLSMMQLLMLQQFTWKGAPHIWMGDEMAMTGSDDPDNRKPLWWDDIAFDNETPSHLSSMRYDYPVSANPDITTAYKELIALRKSEPSLVAGDFSFCSDDAGLMCYRRQLEAEPTITVMINRADTPVAIANSEAVIHVVGSYNEGKLGARSGIVLKAQQ